MRDKYMTASQRRARDCNCRAASCCETVTPYDFASCATVLAELWRSAAPQALGQQAQCCLRRTKPLQHLLTTICTCAAAAVLAGFLRSAASKSLGQQTAPAVVAAAATRSRHWHASGSPQITAAKAAAWGDTRTSACGGCSASPRSECVETAQHVGCGGPKVHCDGP
jgi:hypothetical protein